MQPNSNADAVAKKLAEYKARNEKATADLAEEQKQAEEFEADVRKAEHAASRYDLGEALLEIGVVLTSITLLTRKTAYFLMGLALGVAGLLIAGSALLLR